MSDPIVSSGNLTWDASLDVPFKVAGLGKNAGLTVTLTAHLSTGAAADAAAGQSMTLSVAFGNPNEPGNFCGGGAGGPGGGSFACQRSLVATLTSDKNGHVTGTLTIPGAIDITGAASMCARVSWTLITLTFGSQSVALPDVSDQFNTPGASCPPPP